MYNSIYEFKEDDAYRFASHVNAKTKVCGDELAFYQCPYCMPKPTRDNVRTFSINLKTGQFKCLRDSCGVKGNMITLAKDFDFSLGTEVDEYYTPKKKHKTFGRKNPEKPIISKPKAIEYLLSRGISEEVGRKYDITTQTKNEDILVFPFYNENGVIDFVKYRKTDYDKTKDDNKEWCEKDGKPILFGMYQCNMDNHTLIVTEGQLDSLSVATAGIENAVSVPTGSKGFTFIPYCWNWLCKFDKIIIFGDHEKGHITLFDEFQKRFGRKVWCVRAEDYKDCKDANDIIRKYGAEQIKTCIENAEQQPVKKVVELADVKSINPYDLPKMKTGIFELDRLLCGGLPYGLVHVLAGEEGAGKSTFASQFVANAIDQNINVFVYSGEMPNYLFKSWIDFQLAGRSHILENKNEFGDVSRFISNSNMAAISEWYRDKIYIYDESNVEDEDETEYLLKTIEECIKRYNTRFILIDNLMTGIYADDDVSSEREENQMQVKFVMRLRKMAKNYDVIILLLVHKSKAGAYINNPNNAISGSKKITNVAGLVMTYDRPTDADVSNGYMNEEQRKLVVSKNRIFGKRNMDGIVLDYDEKSKRIYGNHDDSNRVYGWEKDEDGFYNPENRDDPFF